MPRKLDINVAKEIAKTKGGKCLSKRYVNNSTKMLWECKKRHQWSTRLNDVKNNNNWCPYCAGLKLENGLKAAQQIANKRNGQCLSKKIYK